LIFGNSSFGSGFALYQPDTDIPGGTSMNCGKCNAINDGDAVFCTNCGNALNALAEGPRKTRRSYWFALLLVPVLLAAAGMGYY
jgi:hypothetical protein